MKLSELREQVELLEEMRFADPSYKGAYQISDDVASMISILSALLRALESQEEKAA